MDKAISKDVEVGFMKSQIELIIKLSITCVGLSIIGHLLSVIIHTHGRRPSSQTRLTLGLIGSRARGYT